MEPDPRQSDPVPVEADRDHLAIANLLEFAGRICGEPTKPNQCRECPGDKHQHCCSMLHDFGDRLMTLLLDHFHHDEVLMESLPKTMFIREHWLIHRESHAAFSASYNRIVVDLDTGDVAASARKLEQLVIKWAKEHILQFDAELAAMLGRK